MAKVVAGRRREIAIVGGGISGLAAAYYLSPDHNVTLYEAEHQLGGHARTVIAGRGGDQPVDVGFIVFNYATYPYLARLFRDLDVPVIQSHMSFSASINDGQFEYGLNSLAAIAAQKRNLIYPQFYKMIGDILRFGRRAETMANDDAMTIGELVRRLGLGRWFRDHYLIPMCGAIWSTPIARVDQFPAKSMVRFFRNHGLLAGIPQHQWFTVKGGSIEYVRRLRSALIARGCAIRTRCAVKTVKRHAHEVRVLLSDGIVPHSYDELVLACHADQALKLLGDDAGGQEKAALQEIKFQPNRVVLHRDPAQMPKRKACWTSWCYRAQNGRIGVTYWMNRLQAIPQNDPLFVTLNPPREIPDEMVYDEKTFAHPVFDKAAMSAQRVIRAMQGQNRTWFVGAWNRHGFHEDGIASAIRITSALKRRRQREGVVYVPRQKIPESEFLESSGAPV